MIAIGSLAIEAQILSRGAKIKTLEEDREGGIVMSEECKGFLATTCLALKKKIDSS